MCVRGCVCVCVCVCVVDTSCSLRPTRSVQSCVRVCARVLICERVRYVGGRVVCGGVTVCMRLYR